MNEQIFEFFLEKKSNNILLDDAVNTFNDFTNMDINLKNSSDIDLRTKILSSQFERKNYIIEEETIHIPISNDRNVDLLINADNFAIIIIIKGIIGISDRIYKKVVYLNEF